MDDTTDQQSQTDKTTDQKRAVVPPIEPSKVKRKGNPNLRSHLKPCVRNDEKFTCKNPKSNISAFPDIKGYLPEDCGYHVCDYQRIGENGDGDHVNFKVTLRLPLATEEDIKLWLKDHTVTWRVNRTHPKRGKRVLYKVDFRCQHMTRPRGIEPIKIYSKNTNCPAKMTVTLNRNEVASASLVRKSRCTDPHMPDFPTIVSLSSNHNHNLYTPEALRHRDAGEDTKQKLKELFEAGHSPSSAWAVLKTDLQAEHGDDFAFASADGALLPTVHYCYRLYHKIFPQSDVVELEKDGTEVSRETAAGAFDEMFRDLSAKIRSESSLISPAAVMAAVEAYNEIKSNPSKINTALHMFGCQTKSGLASLIKSRARSRALRLAGRCGAARRKAPSGGRRRIGAGRSKVATGSDKSAPVARRRAPWREPSQGKASRTIAPPAVSTGGAAASSCPPQPAVQFNPAASFPPRHAVQFNPAPSCPPRPAVQFNPASSRPLLPASQFHHNIQPINHNIQPIISEALELLVSTDVIVAQMANTSNYA